MWAIVAQKTHTKIQAYPSFTSLKPSENETFLDIQSANQSKKKQKTKRSFCFKSKLYHKEALEKKDNKRPLAARIKS